MASMASTCSPTSLQLRLAMNCKNRGGSPPAVLIRRRVSKLDLYVRTISVVQYGNGVEGHRDWTGRQRVVCCFAADNFAGWSDSDGGDQPVEFQKKKGLQGIVGAGVAGVILVAGLTFAAFSLSKQSTLRPKQHMEPLTVQQEVSLVATDEDNKVENNKSEESGVKLVDSSLERTTDIDKDISSSQELHEALSESKLSDSDSHQASAEDDSKYTISSRSTIAYASVQEDLQSESPFDGKLEAPEMTPNSFNKSDSEITDNSPVSGITHSISEVEQTQNNGELVELLNTKADITGLQGELGSSEANENSDHSLDSSVSSVHESSEPMAVIASVASTAETNLETVAVSKDEDRIVASLPTKENLDTSMSSTETNNPSLEVNYLNESESSGTTYVSEPAYPSANEQDTIVNNDKNRSGKFFEPPPFSASFSSAGIPAPSAVSEALQVSPGKVLVPAVVDQAQGQALAALQVLKVIEVDVQPSDLCSRREYARWLVTASNALSRNSLSKVYPAMYIENATELAFDDVTPDDPDFSSIQGLAEAGLISSRLSNHDLVSPSDKGQGPFYFSPDSPLSRQDLLSWKMALERTQLPEADRKTLYQLSGFRDIDRINPDAWPALIADLSTADQGIISLAFGCTRLFQPDKPVTKAQAAVALATGEASDIVNEELARIEAESMAENAVSAHNALVAQVEQDMNSSFEKELSVEREKINAVERMAEEAKLELERLRSEREADNVALMKERAAVEAEMEMLSRLRREVEDQLQGLLSSKVEISYEKERISKLQKEAENEKQEISRLQYELEVERKALSMARAWAEDEAKRAREHARAIEDARDRWQRHGIKVVVDSDLRDDTTAGVTWVTAGEQFSTEGTVSRAEKLISKLKLMADDGKGKSRELIHKIIQKIQTLVLIMKEWASKTSKQAQEIRDATILKTKGSLQELQQNSSEFSLAVKERTKDSIQGLQQSTAYLGSAVMEGAKRVAGDCRESVEKLTQRFK